MKVVTQYNMLNNKKSTDKFNEIWNGYKNYLLAFIKTKVNDVDTAEDILQEVSINLYDAITRNTEIRNYKNWLFQVTRNTIANYYRDYEKQKKLVINDFEVNADTTPCVCDLSGFIIKKYLPEEYGVPLYLSDIERKKQKEIAEIMNLSLTAVKSRIQRARKKLKILIIDCIEISYNKRGQISDFRLKGNCELPKELKREMERLNIVI